MPKKQRIYNYFYEFASEALHIVIFENFVKLWRLVYWNWKLHLVFASLSKSLTTRPHLISRYVTLTKVRQIRTVLWAEFQNKSATVCSTDKIPTKKNRHKNWNAVKLNSNSFCTRNSYFLLLKKRSIILKSTNFLSRNSLSLAYLEENLVSKELDCHHNRLIFHLHQKSELNDPGILHKHMPVPREQFFHLFDLREMGKAQHFFKGCRTFNRWLFDPKPRFFNGIPVECPHRITRLPDI